MRVPAAFLILSFAALAQKAPPAVDRALRARVTEFFQDHVDGNFRKAYELVAEDTKDYYFATQKVRFKSFKIGKIIYSNHFTNAEVDVTGDRVVRLRFDFPETVMPETMKSMWKIENGKWVWYDHSRPTWITPMGPSDIEMLKSHPGSPDALPDLSQQAMQARAAEIFKQSEPALEKSELVLPSDKSSSEQIVFHNPMPGSVKIYLDTTGKPAGLDAKLNKTDLNVGESAIIKIHFDPGSEVPPASVTIKVRMEPLAREYPIAIKFAPHP